jgi:hypothetical protein
MRSDGNKRARGAEADHLVDLPSQLVDRISWCDRNGKDNFSGSGISDRAKRRAPMPRFRWCSTR